MSLESPCSYKRTLKRSISDSMIAMPKDKFRFIRSISVQHFPHLLHLALTQNKTRESKSVKHMCQLFCY